MLTQEEWLSKLSKEDVEWMLKVHKTVEKGYERYKKEYLKFFKDYKESKDKNESK